MSVKNLPETIEMIVGFLQSESCIICINCFEYSINHESDNCLDCKRKICKNCIDNEYIINKKCNICSNRVCDECNQFLGLEFKLLENKKIVHMICPE